MADESQRSAPTDEPILIAEADGVYRQLLEDELSDARYRTLAVASAEDAQGMLARPMPKSRPMSAYSLRPIATSPRE